MKEVYELYKLIFGNLYLSNLIFGYIKEYNWYIFKDKNYIFKYNEASFKWMVASKNYPLLCDKIKNNIKFGFFQTNISVVVNFLEKFKNDKDIEMLDRFYKINFKGEYIRKYTQDFIMMVIKSTNVIFLNIVYKDLKNTNDKESLGKIIGNISIGSGGNGGNLLESSLKYGDLNVIKYVIDEMGFKETINSYNLIGYGILSDNRNKVVDYLVNGIGVINSGNLNKKGDRVHFSNLIQLDHSIFVKLYKMGLKFKLEEYPISLLSMCIVEILIPKIIGGYKSKLKFYDFLNIFQNSLFSYHLNNGNNNQRFILILKKINHLQNYYSSNDESIKKKYKPNKLNKKDFEIFKSTNGLIFNLKSIFSKDTNIELKEIKYTEFNLKREIFRSFIFDYLMELKEFKQSNGVNNRYWVLMMLRFAINYNEYDHLTLDILQYPEEDVLAFSVYMVSFQNANSKLIEKLYQLYSNVKFFIDKPISKEIIFYNNETTPLEQQIQFLKVIFKYQDIDIDEINILLKHIFSSHHSKFNVEISNQLAEILIKHQHKISFDIFNGNQYIINHFSINYKNLFD